MLHKTEVSGIYREETGMFLVRITKKDPWSGKVVERRKKVESFSIQDAILVKQELVKELNEELEEGKNNFRDLTKASYAAYVEWYLDYQVSNGVVRRNVAKTDRLVFNRFIVPHIGQVKLVQISKRGVFHFIDLLKVMTDKDGIPYSEATYKRAWRLFRASIRFAVKLNYLKEDPTHLVSPRFLNVRPEKEKVALTKEQTAKLLDKAEETNLKFYFICLIALTQGLRWCEITSLQYGDLDFAGNCIHINKSQHKGFLNSSVKNGKSHSSPMVPILRNVALKFCETYGRNKKENDFLFLTKTGKFVECAGFNKKLKNICIELGIPVVSAHQLRATCNTLYLASGVSQMIVSKILNHSSPQMSYLYTRVGNEQKAEVMEAVWEEIK